MQRINILVTGSNGLIGQKIIGALKEGGGFDWTATSRGGNRNKALDDHRYISCDLKDHEALTAVFESVRPHAVIHTAAMANADACELAPGESHVTNVQAVQRLIALCTEHRAQLIHLSTDFVFSGKGGPYEEGEVPHPVNTYGAHKLEAERLIQESAIDWAIVRTILVYGVLPNLSRSNIVLWAKQALESGQQISVVDDQWRMPTLAEDLAKGCLAIAAKKAKGIYHISGYEEYSIYELVEAVADFWHLDKSLIGKVHSASLKQPAQRPQRTGFVLDKAKHVLDFVPHSFEEGLLLVDQQLKALR